MLRLLIAILSLLVAGRAVADQKEVDLGYVRRIAAGMSSCISDLEPAKQGRLVRAPEEYIAHVGGDAKLVPAGALRLDGNRMICGYRPTVLDNNLDDYSAANPGFLIINPKLVNRVSTPLKMWIYSHACAHQYRGPDEELADCFAVQRGRRQGWLSQEGMEEICDFIRPSKGDLTHLSGSHRCESMRRCFADPRVR